MISKVITFTLLFFTISCGSDSEIPIVTQTPDPGPTPRVTLHVVPDDYTTIQEAIVNAASQDTIVVKPGEYFENLIFGGKNILLTSLFYESSDITDIKSTIINGSQGSVDNGSVVLLDNRESSGCIIQGFTITGGTGTIYTSATSGNVTRGGGGIMIKSGSSPTIQYNIIENNESINTEGPNNVAGGGAIRVERSTAKIRNNIIINNSAGFGGGVFLDQTAITFSNNVIAYNSAIRSDFAGGGGLYLDFSLANSSGNRITNNTIYANISEGTSAGLTLAGDSVFDKLEFVNNIIYSHDNNSVVIRNGANKTEFKPSYCLIEGGWEQGSSIQNADPLIDAETFLLKDESPCIDAGNPNTSFNDSGDGSLGTERNDIGAFGGPMSKVLF